MQVTLSDELLSKHITDDTILVYSPYDLLFSNYYILFPEAIFKWAWFFEWRFGIENLISLEICCKISISFLTESYLWAVTIGLRISAT